MSFSNDQNRLQLALEAAGLDLWENDLATGKVTYPARRTLRELGYVLDEAVDQIAFWLSIVHPDDRPGIDAALLAYSEGRVENYRSEFRLRSVDGRWVWFANYGKFMGTSDETGNTRFIGVTFNIDDRKQREEELARINSLLSMQNQQLDQMNKHLDVLSTTDPLTRLHNRRALNDRLQCLVGEGAQPFALLFVDLDDFKKVNDLYGHDVGDTLLCLVAQRLQACIDASELIARFGGDEFVLLLHRRDADASAFRARLEAICQRVLGILAQPYVVGELQLKAYGCIGLARFPEDGGSVELLSKRADIALYQAKREGRNLYRFFETSMETELERQDRVEKELRVALTSRQLELYYQVQVDRQQRPVGAEALLRWHHPTRGLLLPMSFLPDALACGLSHDIDYWVLDTACATLGAWQRDAQLRTLSLSVNISAQAFEHPAFVATVINLLDKYQLAPGKLCLEVTEHVRARSFTDVARVIDQLRARGVCFALDDFGTGYSSLESLKHLGFDQIKIDGSFVSDVTTSRVSQAAVSGVVSIAAAMELPVLAEWVEQQDQLSLLCQLGVDCFQGYLFGKPVPQDVLEISLLAALQPAGG
ncbi:GGDEF and EAL domain-containing protein [Uliginosibacterium sediminicola]|uniref:GGDEF and EAL domain-containing protein n=1 Tax=Uliginosibacterium sediminicola TaxID=2024550 RepID=A0ABU9Z2A6_9RHOO